MEQQTGQPSKVGGDPAKIQIGYPGTRTCVAMGGQEQIRTIVATSPSNFLLMVACIRGPELTVVASEVTAMLRSTRLGRRSG
jgi:hypothetical protein